MIEELRNTHEELRIFARRHPDLSVDCFECGGTGKQFWYDREVDCLSCQGLGTVPHIAPMVRFILERGVDDGRP